MLPHPKAGPLPRAPGGPPGHRPWPCPSRPLPSRQGPSPRNIQPTMGPTATGTAPTTNRTKGGTQRSAHRQTQVPLRPSSTPRQDTSEDPGPLPGIPLIARAEPATKITRPAQGSSPPRRLGRLPAHSSRPHTTGPYTRHLEHQPGRRGDQLQTLPRVNQASCVATAQSAQRQGPVHSQPPEQRVPPASHQGSGVLGTLAPRQRDCPTGPRPPSRPGRPPAHRGGTRVHPRSTLRPQCASHRPRRPISLPQQGHRIWLLHPPRQNAPAASGKPSLPAQTSTRKPSPRFTRQCTYRLPASSRLPRRRRPRPQRLHPRTTVATDRASCPTVPGAGHHQASRAELSHGRPTAPPPSHQGSWSPRHIHDQVHPPQLRRPSVGPKRPRPRDPGQTRHRTPAGGASPR